MTVTTTTDTTTRMRRWAHVAAVVAVTAGAVCAGAGIGSAAPAVEPESDTSAGFDLWVSNATDQDIHVHVHKMKDDREIGSFDGKLDVSARGHSTLADNVDTDTVIEVCWNHRSYERSWHTFEPKWNDLYVFIDHPSFVGADRPFVTGAGGHDDRDLRATGRGC